MSDKIKKFDGGGVIWEAPIAYASSSGGGATLSPLDLNTIQQSYASTFPMDLDYMDMLEKAADEEEFRMLGVKDAPTLEEAEEELAAAAKRLADFQAMKGSAYGLGTTEEGDQAAQYFEDQAALQAELEQARNTYVALGGDPDSPNIGQKIIDFIGATGQTFSDIITLGTGPEVAQTLLDPVSLLLGGFGGTINYAESGKTTPVILGQTSSGMPVGLNIPDPRTILEGGLTTFIPGAAAVATTAGALSLGDEKDQDPTSGVGPTAAGVLTAAAADDDAGGAKTTDGVIKTGGRDITAGGAKTTDGVIKTGGRDITAGGVKTTDEALKTGVRDITAGGVKTTDEAIKTGVRDITAGGVKTTDEALKTGGGGEKKVIETGGGGEKKVIETGGGGEKKVIETGGEATLTPLKTGETPPLKTSTTGGGGSTGTLTLPPSLRGIREEPGDVVDIDYLYDFAKGLDQPFLTTEEQEMLKDLNVYAEGGEVANEDAVNMLTRPRRPGEYGRSYFTPGQFVPTGTALGGAALNPNAIQIPQYTYQRELLPQFGGPAAGVTTPATTTPTTTTPVGTTPTLSDTLGQEGIANLLSNITGMFGGSAGITQEDYTEGLPAATTPAATTPAATTPVGTSDLASIIRNAADLKADTMPTPTSPAGRTDTVGDTTSDITWSPPTIDNPLTPEREEILEFLNQQPSYTPTQLRDMVLSGAMTYADAAANDSLPQDFSFRSMFTEDQQKALGIHESQRTGQGYKFDPITGRNRLYDYDSNTYVDTTTTDTTTDTTNTTDTTTDTAFDDFASNFYNKELTKDDLLSIANSGYPVDQIAAKLKVDTNALNTAISGAQTQDVLDKVDPTDGFSTEEQDAVAQLLAEDKIGIGDITEQYDLGTMDVIEGVLRGGYETPAEMVERLAPYNEGLTEEELIIKLLEEGRTTPAEVASYYGVDESLVRERAGLAGGGAIYGQGYYLGGPTDGMADLVPATIDGTQPAALSDGEFVIPADVVSHLGNGNSEAGAQQLYSMMDRVRTERTGTTKQGPEINPTKMMPA